MIVGHKPRKTAGSAKRDRQAVYDRIQELAAAETERRKQRQAEAKERVRLAEEKQKEEGVSDEKES